MKLATPARVDTPLAIGSMTVAGRLFKSATSETRADHDGFVTEELLDFYRPMFAVGTPMVVTGNLYVSRQGKSAGRQAGIDHDDKIPGLRQWVSLAHAGGTKLIAQLNHGGRQISRALPGERIVSASGVREPMYGSKPAPLNVEEIRDVVQSFVAAARRAHDAGFDGVQVHAAHGYLLSQFLTPHTNRRLDAYGGPLENRARLVREVVSGIRDELPDFPLLVKINGTDDLPFRKGATTDELIQVARWLEDAGADAIEVSRGHYESWPGMVQGHYRGFLRNAIERGLLAKVSPGRKVALRAVAPVVERIAERLRPPVEGFNLAFAERFATALDVPVICVGGFHTPEGISAAITNGRVDAISAARAFIADPHLYVNTVGPRAADVPVCGYCNVCIATFSTTAIDCGSADIRGRRDLMIASRAAAPAAASPSKENK